MTRYYISWHTTGAQYSRCFDSAQEREKFRVLIDCKTAQISTWES